MAKAPTDSSRTLHLGRLDGGADAFAFLRDHYVIYPWLTDGDAIGRVLELDGQALLVWITLVDVDHVEVTCTAQVCDETALQIADVLSFCLALDEPDPLAKLALDDAVIAAALAATPGLRPKRYPSLWEATCGAICAQNVDFRRLYSMMENLCRAFGAPAGGEHAFPSPAALAHASETGLQACKVGYRARALQAAGRWWIEHGEALDRQSLRDAPLSEARAQLQRIPYIGPYSAAIVLAAGCGRVDAFQLDSFTRTILREFYFGGENVADEHLAAFVTGRWPDYGGAVAHLLTTNTEAWAHALGRRDFRRSGARRS